MRIAHSMALVAIAAVAAMAQDIPSASIGLLGGAEIYSIDTAHSYLGFSIRFLGLTDVRGTFRDYRATIVYDDQHPERSSVTVVIDPASVDTAEPERDKDLGGSNFFDTAKYPTIVFQSSSIESQGNERYLVHGNLTIKGTTRPITFPMTRTIHRAADSAWGNIRIGGSGAVTIKRSDFGINGGAFWGEKALGDEVSVTLEILGSRPNYDKWTFNSKEKPSIGEVVLKTAETAGGAAAANQFRDLKRDKPDGYNFAPNELSIAINRLMQRRRIAESVELIKAAMEAYPDRAGFFARGGEAMATLGDRAQAIALYEKAASLAPTGSEPMELLRRLRQ